MIDTHCHLTDQRLGQQLPAVLQRAAAAGVEHMLTIATSIDDSERCVELCRDLPQVRCTVGIHPSEADGRSLTQVPRLADLQKSPAVVAMGEMGLDYHYEFVPRTSQLAVFEAQIALADQLNRPVVIHCRQATDDVLAVLKNHPKVPAVFHCFTDGLEQARRILDSGYLLGFTGIVTFKRSDSLRQVALQTPLDRMLVETDAPYLTPEPHRKRTINEPAMVVHVAALLARLKDVSIEELDQQTTENASRLFRWDCR